MLLKPAPISSSRFTYVYSERMLVAEASDLGPLCFGQVWNDSCDEGLTVVSARTGREVVFVVNHVETRDGDLLYWNLIPAKRGDVAGHCTVRIYND